MKIDFATIVPKLDKLLERGLCYGVGDPDGQMCIEAAITQAMGLPFNDEPKCVAPAVRRFKIGLNDSYRWVSPESRARGLRDIGIAQIGSAGVVDNKEFAKRIAEKTIRVLIPALFRKVFPNDVECLAAADRCEAEGTVVAARAAQKAAYTAYTAAAYTAYTAYTAAAAAAAGDAAAAAAAAGDAAAYTAYTAYTAAAAAGAAAAAAAGEEFLLLGAKICLDVLRELKSPGCEWLDQEVAK